MSILCDIKYKNGHFEESTGNARPLFANNQSSEFDPDILIEDGIKCFYIDGTTGGHISFNPLSNNFYNTFSILVKCKLNRLAFIYFDESANLFWLGYDYDDGYNLNMGIFGTILAARALQNNIPNEIDQYGWNTWLLTFNQGYVNIFINKTNIFSGYTDNKPINPMSPSTLLFQWPQSSKYNVYGSIGYLNRFLVTDYIINPTSYIVNNLKIGD